MNRAIFGIAILAVLITGILMLTVPLQSAEAGIPPLNFRGEDRNDDLVTAFNVATVEDFLFITITVRGPTMVQFTIDGTNNGGPQIAQVKFNKISLTWDTNSQIFTNMVWTNNKGDVVQGGVSSNSNDVHITAKKIAKIFVEDDVGATLTDLRVAAGTVFLEISPVD